MGLHKRARKSPQWAVAIVCAMAVGCGSDRYNAKKNADIRRLLAVEFKDLKPEHIYRERAISYPKLRSIGYGQNKGGGVYVGAGMTASGGAGAILGGALLVGAVAIDATRAETEKRRTVRLNEAVPPRDLQSELRRQVASGLQAQGYEVTPPLPITHKAITPDKPFKIGRLTPTMKKAELDTSLANAAPSDGVLNVQVLNYGITKIDRAFKEAKFIPYVVLEAKLYRRANGKLIYNYAYLGLPSAPLPRTGEFDAAIADTDGMKPYYDEALSNAATLLVKDLQPAWPGE